MSSPTVSELRDVLRSLDLKPLFLVVAGDHCFGIPVPDPVVHALGCHRRALEASLGEGTNRAEVTLALPIAGRDLRVRSLDRAGIAEGIRGRDGEMLEALHSSLVIAGEEELERLRAIARGFLTPVLADHYRREATRLRARLETRPAHAVPDVLLAFRALLTGLHLMTTGDLEIDLRALIGIYDLDYLRPLLARPDRPMFLGDPARLWFLTGEAEALEARFEQAADSPVLPAEPTSEAELSTWLAEAD